MEVDSERERRSTCASEFDYLQAHDDEPPEILIGDDFQAEVPPFDILNKSKRRQYC